MPAKKKSVKKAVSRASKPASRSVHPVHKHYFLEEQEQFFKKHPLAQTLLTVFLVSVLVFMLVFYMNYGKMYMMRGY